MAYANSGDPDQMAKGAIYSGSTLFASPLIIILETTTYEALFREKKYGI